MPRVSIIIATHNRPHLLPRAVESARRAGSDVEIVVVDDASAEETAAACRAMTGIRYVRAERRQRLVGARNIGILASGGDLITFLDDDDVRLPGSLDLQVAALDSAPEAGLVYGQALLGDQDCVPTGSLYPAACPRGDIFWRLLERNFIPCPSVVFRRSCLYRVGLPGAAIQGMEDWELWLRLAELYPAAAVEQPVAILPARDARLRANHFRRRRDGAPHHPHAPRAVAHAPARPERARRRAPRRAPTVLAPHGDSVDLGGRPQPEARPPRRRPEEFADGHRPAPSGRRAPGDPARKLSLHHGPRRGPLASGRNSKVTRNFRKRVGARG